MRKGERKQFCPHGHPYDELNTIIDVKGVRFCKQCRIDRSSAPKTPEEKEKTLIRFRAFRKDKIAKGLCVFCGKPTNGPVLCEVHLIKRRDKRAKERKARQEKLAKARQNRIDSGFCPDCKEDFPLKECTKHWIEHKERRWEKIRKDLRKTGKYKETRNERRRRRLKEDKNYWIECGLRRRVLKAVQYQGAVKSKATAALVGCSTQELANHIESLFLEGMSWENRGMWEIDHIKPCAAFDLTDPEQQKNCFHFSNMQPLWKGDNRKKKDKWEGD